MKHQRVLSIYVFLNLAATSTASLTRRSVDLAPGNDDLTIDADEEIESNEPIVGADQEDASATSQGAGGSNLAAPPYPQAGGHNDVLLDASQDEAAVDQRRALLERLSTAEAMAAQEEKIMQAEQSTLVSLQRRQDILERRRRALELREDATTGRGREPVLANGAVLQDPGMASTIPQSIPSLRSESLRSAGMAKVEAQSAMMINVTETEDGFWERKNRKFWDKVIGIAFYMLQTFIFGFIWVQFLLKENDEKLPESMVRTEEFQYGAFDASECGRDWQICSCALFCPWIRWATTASHPQINFLAYFVGLGIMALLASSSSITFGTTIPLLVLIAVLCRQRIRNAYGLPVGTFSVLAWDCCLWMCCPCCAIAQEARQVEFVDSKYEPYYEEEMGNPSG